MERAVERKRKIEDQQKRYEQTKAEEEKRQREAAAEFEKMDLGEDASASRSNSSRSRSENRTDPSFSPPQSTKRKKAPVPALYVPKDILTRKKVMEASTLGGVSRGTLVNLLAAIVAESGGDLNYYNLSANHLNQKGKAAAVKWAQGKKESYTPPEHPIILWDEKKLQRNQKAENRMPVVIVGDGKEQHIGSFLLADGRAETVATEVVTQAAEWGVGKEGTKPVLQVWDTCPVNSGLTI